jgi:hypothetical protein
MLGFRTGVMMLAVAGAALCTSSAWAEERANNQRFDWVQRFQWMGVNDLFVPNVSAVLGGSNTRSNMVTNFATTASAPDTVDGTERSVYDGGFIGGVSLGMNFLRIPNLLEATGITQALGGTRDKSQAAIGGKVYVLGSSASNTFQGSQITNLGAPPATDNYRVEDNWIVGLSGTVTMPVCQNVNFIAHAGYAWVNKTVDYACNGTCDLATTPRRTFSQDVTVGGPTVGAGVDFVVPGLPFILGFDYTRIFVSDRDFVFGDPAQVQLGFRVDQDIDIFSARATFALGGGRGQSLRWGPP